MFAAFGAKIAATTREEGTCMRSPILLVVSILAMLFVTPHIALGDATGPGSCVLNIGGVTQTCNLFEEDALANPTERPPALSLPLSVVLGVDTEFFVLYQNGTDHTDVNNWSDIVWFQNNGFGIATTVQLFSDPFTFQTTGAEFAAEPEPFTLAAILSGTTTGNTAFVEESLVDPTTFHAFGNTTVNVFSESAIDAPVPEPATLVLLGSALIAVGLLKRRRA
jgi:hypothetical protein